MMFSRLEAAEHERKAKKERGGKPRVPDLDHSKAAVIGSLRSPESQRGYRHAIDEFIQWYCSEPRLSFNRTVVLRYRIHLECRNLAPGTINVRLVPSDDWRTKLRMPDYSAPSSPLASDA